MKAPEPAIEVYDQRLEDRALRAARRCSLAVHLLIALAAFAAGAFAMLFLLSLGD